MGTLLDCASVLSPWQISPLRLSWSNANARIVLDEQVGELVVGTADDCGVKIDGDPYISRHHGKILKQDSAYWLEDLGSSNGIWMNGHRVGRVQLLAGMRLMVGRTELCVHSKIPCLKRKAPNGLGRHPPGMTRTLEVLKRAVGYKWPILMSGETGVGKDIAVQFVAREMGLSTQGFQVLNCAAIPYELAEAELFGAERGAYTGAVSDRPGLFERAGQGLVFLDELGELPLSLQAKLLRVIENREVRRVGGACQLSVRARIIAATHRDLDFEVKEGRFREDLLYRLNVLNVHIPPLRERREDIRYFANHFVNEFSGGAVCIAPQAFRWLESYDWPGNIRELKNVIARAIFQCHGGKCLEVHHLSFSDNGPPASVKPPEVGTLSEAEKYAVKQALSTSKGNISQAANRLGISRSTLYRKIDAYSLGDIAMAA